MADSTITFFLEKLSNFAAQEAALFGEVEVQIKLLWNELEWMRLFLREGSANRTSDERVSLWVNQMRDVCYDAEDVLDDFMFRIHRTRQQRLNNLKCLRYLPSCVGVCDKLRFVHDLKSRMENINMTVEKILINKTRYGIEDPKDLLGWSFSMEQNVPLVNKVRVVPDEKVDWEADLVGMKYEVEQVKHSLIAGEGEMESRVVSVVGTGSLGKTTVAKRVYNDRDVKQHFSYRAWVTANQEYRLGELLMRIAISFRALNVQEKIEIKESELGNIVLKFLTDKTYLIVLDDLWSIQVWNDLTSYFPPSNASRVLITTRNRAVALHVKSVICEVRVLGKDESGELLLKKVFGVTTPTLDIEPYFRQQGDSMINHCDGLPLSIALLGGLLSRKEKRASWEKIRESIEQNPSDQVPFVLRIMLLAYNDLPFYLKSCFLYCGLFPEDRRISARKLICLWIAEGFIQNRRDQTLEEVAEDYLEELIQRSMIQVAKRRLDGRAKSCYVHDLVRYFILSEVNHSKLFEVWQNNNFTTTVTARRLSFHHHLTGDDSFENSHSSHLRSLICFSNCLGQKSLQSLIQDSKLLTVLNLEGLQGMDKLPKTVGTLVHLKFLCLRGSRITRLPNSIGKLVNLLILDLHDSSIERIPYTVWKLPGLTHLYGGNGLVLTSFMDWLWNGHLGVRQLKNLQVLSVRWGGYGKLTQLGTQKMLQDPMLTLEKLPNLRILRILSSSRVGKKIVCSSRGFPQLEYLTLSGLEEVEELIMEEEAMPELKFLKIERCPQMKRLPDGLFQLRNLRQVKLVSMPSELYEEMDRIDCGHIQIIRDNECYTRLELESEDDPNSHSR